MRDAGGLACTFVCGSRCPTSGTYWYWGDTYELSTGKSLVYGNVGTASTAGSLGGGPDRSHRKLNRCTPGPGPEREPQLAYPEPLLFLAQQLNISQGPKRTRPLPALGTTGQPTGLIRYICLAEKWNLLITLMYRNWMM